MQKFIKSVMIEARHTDKRNHASWIAQHQITQDVAEDFLKSLKIDSDVLEPKGIRFDMGENKNVRFHQEILLGEVVDVSVMVWIPHPTLLEFKFDFYRKNNDHLSEMGWVTPLVSISPRAMCRIPDWIVKIIGTDTPEDWQFWPRSRTK